ncbi:MAG: thiamine diphosphokinase [Elusimicrobia bacterium]|nr:thiamine diphosphokinase [Elusimicrobiota bacterium]MDY6039705.1 thiamine diphosphokinase [Elusimicrobiaceae bacterium]
MPFSRVLLIGNGEMLPADYLDELVQKADFILAADGGADRALAAGVTPDAVIGDLDSVSAAAKKQLGNDKFIFVDNQNNTDLEKSLDWIVQNNCKECVICGFAGGRLDFTLGNFLSVYPYVKKMDICFAGPGWRIYPLAAGRKFTCQKDARVSLIPLKTCTGVTLKGLQYPLTDARLSWEHAGRSLSNQTTGKEFQILLKTGYMLVYAEEH